VSRQHLTTHLTIAPTSPSSSATYVLLRRWEASPPTNHLPPGNHHHPTPITHHPTPITQHPSPITQIGEMSGEMSGEVFRQHPTIRNARLQRILAHFGEVL